MHLKLHEGNIHVITWGGQHSTLHANIGQTIYMCVCARVCIYVRTYVYGACNIYASFVVCGLLE